MYNNSKRQIVFFNIVRPHENKNIYQIFDLKSNILETIEPSRQPQCECLT